MTLVLHTSQQNTNPPKPSSSCSSPSGKGAIPSLGSPQALDGCYFSPALVTGWFWGVVSEAVEELRRSPQRGIPTPDRLERNGPLTTIILQVCLEGGGGWGQCFGERSLRGGEELFTSPCRRARAGSCTTCFLWFRSEAGPLWPKAG